MSVLDRSDRRVFAIGGVLVDGHDRPEMVVLDSATEEVLGSVPEGTAADIDRAVAAAKVALPGWRATPVAERADALDRIAAGLRDRTEELAALISRETGMPLPMSGPVHVGTAVRYFETAAEVARRFEWSTEIEHVLVERTAVGVVGAITPWNFPLIQLAKKASYALAAGCTVVAKPSEVAPLDALILAEVMTEVGLPAGAFNVVSGRGDVAGEALSSHPDVAMVTFTGSTRAGARVAAAASATIKKVTLELGGKSAAIFCDDLDEDELTAALTAAIGSAFVNAGQACTSLSRFLVPRTRLAEAEGAVASVVGAKVVGDPFAEGTDIGPLASAEHRDRVAAYIDLGVAEGARLLVGGPWQGADRGYFVQPTAFSGTNDMRIAREEIFGPVLVVIPYEDDDDAVRLANDSVYGLSGGVWSADVVRATSIARRMESGSVAVNGAGSSFFAPFGGVKRSGVGREAGVDGLLEFLEAKAINRPT